MAAERGVDSGRVVHATVIAEKTYPVSAGRAFEAWRQPDAHQVWHVPDDGWVVAATERNVVPGGRDFCRFGPPGEPIHHSDGRFLIVEPERRVVSAGTMFCRDVPTSATLCTVEFVATPSGGVRLVLTDQSAYFDGRHHSSERECGWQVVLERFGQAVT